MNWQNYPLIRLIIPFIFGMVGAYLYASLMDLLILSVICCALLALLFFFLKKPQEQGNGLPSKSKYRPVAFGVVAMALSFAVGMSLYTRKYQSIAQGMPQDTTSCRGILSELPQEKMKSWALNLKQENGTHILLYIGKEKGENAASASTRISELNIGDTVFANIKHLNATKDGDNDTFAQYRKHLFSHGVCATCYTPSDQWHSCPRQSEANIFLSAKLFQQKLHNMYNEHGINGKSGEVIEAMTIGMKGNLDKDTRQKYATAGTSHVLAMSGMHVGLIAMIFQFFFAAYAMPHQWMWLCNIFIIAFLWCFVIIAGQSPSIVRATLMLTILLLCQSFTHELMPLNSCALAVAIMLCMNPLYINDVGFQLSFVSVASICLVGSMRRYDYPPPIAVFTLAERYCLYILDMHHRHRTPCGIPFWQSSPVGICQQCSHNSFRLYYYMWRCIMVDFPVVCSTQRIADQCYELVSRYDEWYHRKRFFRALLIYRVASECSCNNTLLHRIPTNSIYYKNHKKNRTI